MASANWVREVPGPDLSFCQTDWPVLLPLKAHRPTPAPTLLSAPFLSPGPEIRRHLVAFRRNPDADSSLTLAPIVPEVWWLSAVLLLPESLPPRGYIPGSPITVLGCRLVAPAGGFYPSLNPTFPGTLTWVQGCSPRGRNVSHCSFCSLFRVHRTALSVFAIIWWEHQRAGWNQRVEQAPGPLLPPLAPGLGSGFASVKCLAYLTVATPFVSK